MTSEAIMGFSNLPLQKDQIEYSICLTLLPPGGGGGVISPPQAFRRTFRHEAHARGRRNFTQNSRFAIVYDIKMHFGGKKSHRCEKGGALTHSKDESRRKILCFRV